MFIEDNYENCDFSNTYVQEDEINKKAFQNCDFKNADFSDVSMVFGCRFTDCNFASATLNGAVFRNCAFLNCKFNFATFFSTTFKECKMTGSSFTNTDISLLAIDGGDWSYTELRFLEFYKQTLVDVSFRGADLTSSKFVKSKLDGCHFEQAIVDGVSFRGSDIRGSDICGIDVLSVDLKDTVIDLAQCIIIAETVGAKYKP